MREMKKAEERRNEILDAADELFTQKGLTVLAPAIFLKKWALHGARFIITLSLRKILWMPSLSVIQV